MKRVRTVPAAPVRSASATWELIENMIVQSLEPSASIRTDDVRSGLAGVASVGRLLVAGGHLDRHPVTLVAAPVHLSIFTVSGDDALGTDDPEHVVGAATATDWTLYLPSPDPLGAIVEDAVRSHPNLSADEPPGDVPTSAAGPSIDREALARHLDGRR